MSNDINETQSFTSKDVAKRLGIETVTVRKYSQELESKGYKFQKNDKDWRVYYSEDIKALAYFQVLRNQGDSVEESALKVAELQQSDLVYRTPDTTIQEDDMQDEMKEFIQQQENFNKELLERLDKQQKYITEKLEVRDQQLMQALNQSMETQKLIAAAQEEKEKPTKKWWEFWK